MIPLNYFLKTYFKGDDMNSRFVKVLVGLIGLVVALPSFAKGGGGHGGGAHSSNARATSSSSGGSHAISGHTKSNGTYVAPARATNPDKTKNNNYSTRGNTNPLTGKSGTKPRDGEI